MPSLQSRLPTIEIDVDSVIIGDRIRKDFSGVADLVESIREHGLIQPIVVTSDHRLIAGENRIRAHRELGWKKIKAVYLEVVDAAHLTILEASENIVRRDFTWQEQVLAIDRVHSLKSLEYAIKSEAWGVRETGRLLNTAKSSIHRAVFIAGYLRANDPEVSKASGLKEAFAVLLKRKEDELNRALVAQSLPKGTVVVPQKLEIPDVTDDAFFADEGSTGFTPGIGVPIDLDERPGGGAAGAVAGAGTQAPSIPLSEMFHHADSVAWLKTRTPETFDAVITDWPYGIDMDNLQQDGGGMDISSTRFEHDVRSNEQLHQDIVPLIYSVIKPNGFFVTWMDVMHWERTYAMCVAAGFKVQRWPLIWHKTSVCQNMAAQYNFTKNFEIAIVCRKGNATLLRPQQSSVWSGGNDAEAKALGHPFAKPFGLWEWVYNATCLRGASVLDPFVGRGSSVIPAIRLGLRPTGVETNEAHYNALQSNMMNFYKSLDANCTFR